MGRSLAIVLLLLVLTMGLVLPVVSVGVSASVAPGERSVASADIGAKDQRHGVGRSLQSVASAVAVANNTTQHDNPETVGGRNDVGDVTRWLERRLGGSLERSTIELSRGEADLAKRILGEEFADQFERYAYVASRTGTEDDDRASERFQETRETQEEFATAVQEYRETREEYEEARRNGDEARARRLARELQRLARSTDRTGSDLRNDYRTLSNATAADLREASLTAGDISRNISQQQTEIVDETFVRSTLTLRPDSRRVSFLDPLRLDGRLVGENGSELAERTVRLRIGERTIRTRTNADGTFTATYRPTVLRADEQPVAVRFVPRDESVYLGSNGSVIVSVAQITPDITVDRAPEAVAFDNRLEVTGRVSAEGVGAGTVPVVVRLGGVRLGTTRTNPNGTYSFGGRIPADVDDGERPLTATVPLEGRALAGVERSTEVRIDPTATTVSVSGEQVTAEALRVSGTLETTRSNGIPDQPVDLMLEGQSIATVRTDPDGDFAERVAVPADLVDEDRNVSVTLAARFDRPGSNLKPSRARTMLRLQPLAAGDDGVDGAAGDGRILPVPEGLSGPIAVAVAVGGLLVLVGGAVYLRRRREGGGVGESDDVTADSAVDPQLTAPPEPSPGRTSSMPAGADAALDSGNWDTAVKLAFGTLKRTTTERLGLPDGTHWEFFVACREAGLDDDRIDTLRRLTETYEQAAFAPETVSETDANWVVDAAAAFDGSLHADG